MVHVGVDGGGQILEIDIVADSKITSSMELENGHG
jgi:hypothetical protein